MKLKDSMKNYKNILILIIGILFATDFDKLPSNTSVFRTGNTVRCRKLHIKT